MPELIWDGKYDSAGRRTASPRIALPFQTVETVNESAQERQHTLDLFATERIIQKSTIRLASPQVTGLQHGSFK